MKSTVQQLASWAEAEPMLAKTAKTAARMFILFMAETNRAEIPGTQ